MSRLQTGLFSKIVGLNGGLFGCACTAFAPNSLPIRLMAMVGCLGLVIALNVTWARALQRAQQADTQ